VSRTPIDFALRCYPNWWTERYGDEMLAVIDDLKTEGRSEKLIAMGLLRDAMRSRLQARGMPRTYGLLANRTSTSVAMSTLTWLVTIPVLLFTTGRFTLKSSSGLVETGFPFQLTMLRTKVAPIPGAHWVLPTISTTTRIIGLSTLVMQFLFVLTLLALTIGLAVLRNGIVREKERNQGLMYLLTWVPPFTVCAIVLLDIAQSLVNDGRRPINVPNEPLKFVGGHPALAALMGELLWAVAIGGWLLSMIGLAVVANRVTLPPETLRFGRTVSVLTSVSLSFTFIAFIVWGVAIDIQNHQSHVAGAIVATYPRHDLWLPMSFALGLASVASIYGANVARRSWRIIYANRLWDT
jgi:hypothetical protein